MGNSIALPLCISNSNINNNIKPISKILELEGWSIVYINNNYVYYNKFKNIVVSDYPVSISDYDDIYNFYLTELLTPEDTINLLNNVTHNDKLEEDIHKITNIIKKIESENDLTTSYTNYNSYTGLCFS
tara:strand:+ start:124 stop:510 length:387 start_codon:yes stop_codon:yes gene_type:complete